eukprot:4798824-Pleurochrysis_carterae.AAC.1
MVLPLCQIVMELKLGQVLEHLHQERFTVTVDANEVFLAERLTKLIPRSRENRLYLLPGHSLPVGTQASVVTHYLVEELHIAAIWATVHHTGASIKLVLVCSGAR